MLSFRGLNHGMDTLFTDFNQAFRQNPFPLQKMQRIQELLIGFYIFGCALQLTVDGWAPRMQPQTRDRFGSLCVISSFGW